MPAAVAAKKRGAARVRRDGRVSSCIEARGATASLNDVEVETRLFDWDELRVWRRRTPHARTVCILKEPRRYCRKQFCI